MFGYYNSKEGSKTAGGREKCLRWRQVRVMKRFVDTSEMCH